LFDLVDLRTEPAHLLDEELDLSHDGENSTGRQQHRPSPADVLDLLVCLVAKVMLSDEAANTVVVGLAEEGFGGELLQQIQLPVPLQVVAQLGQSRRPFSQDRSQPLRRNRPLVNQLLSPSQKLSEFLGHGRIRLQGAETISTEPDHLDQHERIDGIILATTRTINVPGPLGALGLNSKNCVSLLYQSGQ
jgi:hypothetical protein